MSRSIWRGDISFGLVTIPVALHPAEERKELAFHLLDGRDLAPISQQRVNSVTGEVVPWEEIAKGFEYEDGHYVVVTDSDFRAANVEATQTIDVLAMIHAEEIDPVFFDHPYYLVPASKAARKPYAILRETLARTGRVGIASVVIRTRQHIVALIPDGDAIVLDVLRFAHELRGTDDLELPGRDLAELNVTEAELELADQLVAAMVGPWEPEQYRDTYRDDVMALIRQKIETGEVAAPLPVAESAPSGGQVVDIMSLLKRSVEERRAAAGDG
ncbi:MAG: non-homologous end joining protein Ku [Coriobacteriia bacterium]